MAELILLVSYPKSGNTWLRTFISNYIANQDKPLDINNLRTHGIASGRDIFDSISGLDSSDLSADEIDNIRPEVYTLLTKDLKETQYVKVHDAYTFVNSGPMFPRDNTKVVYILRNPLDVVVSYAHHRKKSIESTIEALRDKDHTMSSSLKSFSSQLRQKLLTWSEHVVSWVDLSPIPSIVIRYEDMLDAPVDAFSRVVEFMGLEYDYNRLKKAINFSSFDVLKTLEEEKSFREAPPGVKNFFREGKKNTFSKHLSQSQIEEIINDHWEVMGKYGYLEGLDDK